LDESDAAALQEICHDADLVESVIGAVRMIVIMVRFGRISYQEVDSISAVGSYIRGTPEVVRAVP
jgi:hypothetical protein